MLDIMNGNTLTKFGRMLWEYGFFLPYHEEDCNNIIEIGGKLYWYDGAAVRNLAHELYTDSGIN